VPRCLLVFEPPDGGVAENVARLALGLPERGFDVALAGPEHALPYDQLGGGVAIERLPFQRGYGHPPSDARALAGLVGVLRSGDFDLVHCHSAKAGVIGRLAAIATRTPRVYSPHCFPFVGPWGVSRRAFSTGVERALGPLTDAIVCVADQERRLALEKRIAPAERLHVVHNGADECAAAELDTELEEFKGDGVLAATISVLRPQKAVHNFVAAAPAILDAVPEARLAVIGDGELRVELQRQADSLGVADRLRFFPFRPPSARQLRSLDVYVLPSAWEAFPIGVLEAMACGVPQVATDVGGTGEALVDGETGLLVPPDRPDALARALVRVLRDGEERGRMAAAGRERHAVRFRVERMLDATAAVYRQVLDARG
jgi:glycosyltransferase involved in cell wall biosynthesis